jgi:voltage-gated potassium channel
MYDPADDERATAWRPVWRRRLGAFIHHPKTELAILGLILCSVLLVFLELSAPPDHEHAHTLQHINDMLTGVFIIELCVRFFVEKRKSRFFRKYFLDILAVMPFFHSLRLLRIFRVLRLFRFGVLMTRRLSRVRGGFWVVRAEYILILLALIVAVAMGAFSLRIAEGKPGGEFDTIEKAVWFSIMTVIGGEPIGGNPRTPLGLAITVGLMLSGLTVFGLLIGTVSAVMGESLRNMRFRSMEIDELEGHVVICGWNRAGRLLVEELLHDKRFSHVVVISENASLQQDTFFQAMADALYLVVGDYTRLGTLKEAGVERAAYAMLLADTSKEERSSQDRDARTVLAAMLIEKLNKKIYTVVQLLNRDNEVSLRQVGVEEIVVSDEYVGNIMATVAKNRGIVNVLDELLTAKYGHQFYRGPVPESLHDKSVAEALVLLKVNYDATLIAVDLNASDPIQGRVRVNPPRELILKREHHIIVAASRSIF